MYDLVTVGHVLLDIRMLVDEFPGVDRLSVVKGISFGGGGSAANVAVYASRFGLRTACIGKVAMDDFGKLALKSLLDENVDISGVRIDVMGETGFTVVIINKQGQIMMLGFPGVSDQLKPKEVDEEKLKNAKFVHIASLNVETSAYVAKLAKKHEATVLFDPGRKLSELGLEKLKGILENIDIALPNAREILAMTGADDIKEAAKMLLDLGVKYIVVKMGGEGAHIFAHDFDKHIPAFKVRTVDTTGAGDSFAAALIKKLNDGADIVEAVVFANATAALKTTVLGARAKLEVSTIEKLIKNQIHLLPQDLVQSFV